MAVKSKRLRFEVLNRDGFCCQYCGRSAPGVALHVDHILPESEGGRDELENLVASCADCNLGKATRIITSAEIPPDPGLVARIQDLVDRELQLRQHAEARRLLARREEIELADIQERWSRAWNGNALPKPCWPWPNSLLSNLRDLGFDQVADAIDVTARRFDHQPSPLCVQYFIGVLRWKRAAAKNRVAWCVECGEHILLHEGEDPSQAWIHTACQAVRDEAAAQEAKDWNELELRHAEMVDARTEGRFLTPDYLRTRTEIDEEVAAWDRIASKAAY